MNKQLKDIKKALQESLDERIAMFDKVKKEIETIELPEFPVDPRACVDIWRDIDLTFPYDPQIIKEVLVVMKNADWYVSDLVQICQMISCSKDNISIDINFSIGHKDSTCVKTKIGEKKQIVSIYEVTCKEGGEEKTFVHEEAKEENG